MSVDRVSTSIRPSGVDGKNHALEDYADAPVLVLIQSCEHSRVN